MLFQELLLPSCVPVAHVGWSCCGVRGGDAASVQVTARRKPCVHAHGTASSQHGVLCHKFLQ